jgi:serine/threonine protein kinase
MDLFFATHFKQPVALSNLTNDDRGIHLVHLETDNRYVVVKPMRPKEVEVHQHLLDDETEEDAEEFEIDEYGTMFNEIPKHDLGILTLEDTLWLPQHKGAPGCAIGGVLEYAEGGDLFNFIWDREGDLEKDDVKEIFREIVQAVLFCHNRHVIHNDIKPENILITREGKMKLTDFGGAVFRYDEGRDKRSMGRTILYCAPELFVNDLEYDEKVDIWSLGVVLYELIWRSHPFFSVGKTVHIEEDLTRYAAVRKVSNKVMHFEPWFSNGLSEDPIESDLWYNQDNELMDLVLRMLEKDPTKRMSCDDVLAHPWLSE